MRLAVGTYVGNYACVLWIDQQLLIAYLHTSGFYIILSPILHITFLRNVYMRLRTALPKLFEIFGHFRFLILTIFCDFLQNGLATKVEKSRKQMKERKNRAKKIRGVKKVINWSSILCNFILVPWTLYGLIWIQSLVILPLLFWR